MNKISAHSYPNSKNRVVVNWVSAWLTRSAVVEVSSPSATPQGINPVVDVLSQLARLPRDERRSLRAAQPRCDPPSTNRLTFEVEMTSKMTTTRPYCSYHPNTEAQTTSNMTKSADVRPIIRAWRFFGHSKSVEDLVGRCIQDFRILSV